MRRMINSLISIALSAIRFAFFKLIHGKRLMVSLIERFSPNAVFEMGRNTKVFLGKRVRVHSGSKIKVRNQAQLSIGRDVSINYNCIIVCHDNISIGLGTELGPLVCIYDHDHDYKVGLKAGKFKTAPIHIGENCWIGANTVILKGTMLGNNCVVGAGSVIRDQYPDNSVIVQKRKDEVQSYSGQVLSSETGKS